MKRPFGIHCIGDIYAAGVKAGIDYDRCSVQAVAAPFDGNRLVAAWWVLTGRAYALLWPSAGDLETAIRTPEEAKAIISTADSLRSFARHYREKGDDCTAGAFDSAANTIDYLMGLRRR